MTGVFFDPPRTGEAWRDLIYKGDIIILSSTPEMLALVEHTRRMIEDAFAPLDPQRAKDIDTAGPCFHGRTRTGIYEHVVQVGGARR